MSNTDTDKLDYRSSLPLLRQRIPMIIGLLAIWLLFTEASPGALMVGIPFILLAALVIPGSIGEDHVAGKLNLARLPAFIWLFIIESLHGGIDVSRRVLSRKPRLDPGYFDYDMRLQSSHARHLLISSISLLPGTLSALWQDDRVRIHTLDMQQEAEVEIRKLETSIAGLFGETL